MTTSAHRLAALAATLLGFACSSAPVRSAATASNIPPVAGERRATNGVEYIDIVEGRGAVASTGQCVYVHYSGWTESGKLLDTSRDSLSGGVVSPPFAVVLGTKAVIAGWDSGIPGMRIGGRRRLFIPYRLGYGDAGNPPTIPKRAALVFDIELLALSNAIKQGVKSTCPPWR